MHLLVLDWFCPCR